MSHYSFLDMGQEMIFLAGERPGGGTYVDIETGRELILEPGDYLPATLDGRVATYTRRAHYGSGESLRHERRACVTSPDKERCSKKPSNTSYLNTNYLNANYLNTDHRSDADGQGENYER